MNPFLFLQRHWRIFAGFVAFLFLFYVLKDFDWNGDGQPDGRFIEFAYAAIVAGATVVLSLWARWAIFNSTLGTWVKERRHRAAFEGLDENQKFAFYAATWFVLLWVFGHIFASILGGK